MKNTTTKWKNENKNIKYEKKEKKTIKRFCLKKLKRKSKNKKYEKIKKRKELQEKKYEKIKKGELKK